MTVPTPLEKELTPFQLWYERYPRKKAPKPAEKAYNETVKEVTPEHLQATVEAYRALWDEHIKKMTTKERKAAKVFVPYPATWLRAGSYDDEEIQEYLSKPKPEELFKITPDSPGWAAWVEQRVAVSANIPAAVRHFWSQQKDMLVPTEWPPQGDE